MHGLGNDFIVINGIDQSITLTPKTIQQLSARHTGIGFDQCLIIERSYQPGIDFVYRIFNANGEAVGQCGNGARCIARFIERQGLSSKKSFTIATATTQMILRLNDDESVTVEMGVPKLQPECIPLCANTQKDLYDIRLSDEKIITVHALSVGNPHAILLVDDLESAPVNELGQLICEHPMFPEQTNVGFLNIQSPDHIKLRVYERGCGETQACGSGAVAAMAAGRLFHQLNPRVRVSLPGGDLWVEWTHQHHAIQLTGPATFVYDGQLVNKIS